MYDGFIYLKKVIKVQKDFMQTLSLVVDHISNKAVLSSKSSMHLIPIVLTNQANKTRSTAFQKHFQSIVLATTLGVVMALSADSVYATTLVKATVTHPRPTEGNVNEKSMKGVYLSSKLIVGSDDKANEKFILKNGQLNYKREKTLTATPSKGSATHVIVGNSHSKSKSSYSVGGPVGSMPNRGSSSSTASMGISITIVDLSQSSDEKN